MLYKEIMIQVPGSMPETKLTAYILDTPKDQLKIKKRPVILLCPGGGYGFTSFREGEPIAMYFLNKGYHVCILEYSTAPARFPVALMELGTAVKILREHAEEWKIDKDAIIVQGSSAGGHLAACFGVFWNQDMLAQKLNVEKEELKPNGLLLSYPVITTDADVMHEESFRNLLGEKYEEHRESLSLEKLVGNDMPPCFIWHTNEDTRVPAENSLLLVLALRRHQIPVELHLFEKGMHGLATASVRSQRADGEAVQEECVCWLDLADVWVMNLCKHEHTS